MLAVAFSIISVASQFLGQPYVWGGKSPETGFDCSGLVWYAYHVNGIELANWSKSQWFLSEHIDSKDARPGDLVFFENTYDMRAVHGYWVQPPFISHGGIYIGDNKMINANSRGIEISDLTEPYWKEHFYSFGRVLNERG